MSYRVRTPAPATKPAASAAEREPAGSSWSCAQDHAKQVLPPASPSRFGHDFGKMRIFDSGGAPSPRPSRAGELQEGREGTSEGEGPSTRRHAEAETTAELTNVIPVAGEEEDQELELPATIPESDEEAADSSTDFTRSDAPVRWGRARAALDTSGWGGTDADGAELKRGPAGADFAIVNPQAVSWGASESRGHDPELIGEDAVIVSPTIKSAVFMETTAGRTGVLGITSRPSGFTVPDFAFNTVDKGVSFGVVGPKFGAKAAPKWFAMPKQTKTADEGSNISFAVGAGVQKRTATVGGKPVFLDMSAAMAARNLTLETEHPDDHRLAFKMSLKEADDILKNNIDGKSFGPESTEAAAKQMVLDEITKNLTHPQLGNDQTKWGAQYTMLSAKTGERDAKGWHSFASTRKAVNDAKGAIVKFVDTVSKGTTKVVPSAKVVKY